MSCLKLQVPAMRVWRGLSARLGLRRPCHAGAGAGLGWLRKEVRTCEYGDVHVMWAMLSSKPSSDGGKGAAVAAATWQARTTGRKPAVVAAWSRLAFYCCGL